MGEKITVYVKLNKVLISWPKPEILTTTAEQPKHDG